MSEKELGLIIRAMILLSCVVDGEESKLCQKIASEMQSELRVRKMLFEETGGEHE